MIKLTILIKTKLHGNCVGLDEWGNSYYESKSAVRFFGRKERWVLYEGECEASKVPSAWFSWLHYQTNVIPNANIKSFSWEKKHHPNLTGTNQAYYPSGSTFAEGTRDAAMGDYQKWAPPKN